jgi:hypothetical protein
MSYPPAPETFLRLAHLYHDASPIALDLLCPRADCAELLYQALADDHRARLDNFTADCARIVEAELREVALPTSPLRHLP